MRSSIDSGRRAAIARGARLAAIIIVATVAGRSASVAAKATKSELQYQEHPHNGKECGECKFFKPDSPNADSGQCSLVEGPIRRDGWCTAFEAKSGG
ncbi:MAG TPA: high-potential iron-sulfur protein [Casimicrobiaceae bacterium]|nr:high-potential iron-sulfur protein [Casimicrobiaceae bacterium]